MKINTRIGWAVLATVFAVTACGGGNGASDTTASAAGAVAGSSEDVGTIGAATTATDTVVAADAASASPAVDNGSNGNVGSSGTTVVTSPSASASTPVTLVVSDSGGGSAASSTVSDSSSSNSSTAAAASICDGVGIGTPSVPGATLVLQLAGPDAGVSHDILQVAGRARIGGVLQLIFDDSFTPVKGQSFKVVQAGCLAGTFASITANKNLVVKSSQDTTSLTVTIQ